MLLRRAAAPSDRLQWPCTAGPSSQPPTLSSRLSGLINILSQEGEDRPVLAGMGAVAPCTLPGWRVCGVLGRPWLRRRACLVLWPSYLRCLAILGETTVPQAI